jgi:hypothetical protein
MSFITDRIVPEPMTDRSEVTASITPAEPFTEFGIAGTRKVTVTLNETWASVLMLALRKLHEQYRAIPGDLSESEIGGIVMWWIEAMADNVVPLIDPEIMDSLMAMDPDSFERTRSLRIAE